MAHQLMLGWYSSTPVPDRAAAPLVPKVLGHTDLSRRLRQALDQELFCDLSFCHGQEELAKAHRVVLSRNPHLNLRDVSNSGVPVPAGLRTDLVQDAVRAHYVEVEHTGVEDAVAINASGSAAACKLLRSRCTAEEWQGLEALFGPLDASGVGRWAALRAAVSSEHFADCSLRLHCGGFEVRAHRAVVGGAEDAAYFNAALKWPSSNGAGVSVNLPEGLSHEVFKMLMQLRYGGSEVGLEGVLEARHFADVLDWAGARRQCEQRLEDLLVDSQNVDAESLLAVVSHAEESLSMPPRLKMAALAASIRHWSRVMSVAATEEALPAGRRAELGLLSRIRRRDGHICGSLEEYLHAAADDLVEWEERMTSSATPAARKKLEAAWSHWHQMLFEYGYINGTVNAEQWRARVAARREALREDRCQKKTAEMRLPAGKVWFEASTEWREVLPNAICPGGLEYRFDMQTGRNYARLC